MKQKVNNKNESKSKIQNKVPMIMKLEGKYEAYENGELRENITMQADYDGDDLEVNIMDKQKKKETYLQLSNDQLFDLMSHEHTEQSLLKQLENEIKVNPIKSNNKKNKEHKISKNNKKGLKKNKKTRRKKSNKGRNGKKNKQTRRKK